MTPRESRIAAISAQLASDPHDIFLNYALGLEFAAEASRSADALRQFETVLKLDPTYVPAYYQCGKLYEAAGNTDAALRYLREGMSHANRKGDRKAAGEFAEAIFTLED